jgi:diketogulonate reductase-like aldo/keto reductase
MNLQTTKTLSNGYSIPVVGFGTYKVEDGQETEQAVHWALQHGYRHIDCAAVYHNEKSVRKAIEKSGIDRSELFITSKVWNTDRGYEKTMKAFQKTIDDLGVNYLDLYLIHWPAAAHQYANWEEINLDTWQALIDLYKQGKVRAIGVSNFKPHHLKALMETEIKPMVDQIEYNPGWMQKETVDYCKEHDIVIEAWSPLGRGNVLKNETLQEIAHQVGKSTAQVCLRWELQHDIVILPKSVHEDRIVANTQIFDFELSDQQMKTIDGIVIEREHRDPDTIDF